MPKKLAGFRTKGKGRRRKVYPIYAGYRGMPRGKGVHVSSVVEAQRLRSKRAQQLDAALKAKTAPTQEHWLSEPNRYDWQGIDAPKSAKGKARWKLRDIKTMTEAELVDYLEKLGKIPAFRDKPYDQRIRAERRFVKEELAKRRETEKDRILKLALTGKLTYKTTPDDNPFEAVRRTGYYQSLTPEQYQEAQNHDDIHPFILAKESTKETIEMIEALGYKSKPNQIFSDYVNYHKLPWEKKSNTDRPYSEYNKMWNRTTGYMDEVKNVAERKLAKQKTISVEDVTEEFSHRDRNTVKVALNRVIKDEGWVREKGRIRSTGTGGIEKPRINGLKALDNLGAFQEVRFGRDETRQLLVNVTNGKATTRFMDPTHVSLFDGEVDVTNIPGLRTAKGKKLIVVSGGDTIAFNRPDYAYISSKDKDEKTVVLKKFNVTRTHTEYAEGDYWRKNPKKVKEKVTKKFIIHINKPSGKDIEEQTNIPLPKFQTKSTFTISAKDLKDLAKFKRRDDPYTEAVKIFTTKKGKTTLARYADPDVYREEGEKLKPPRVKHAITSKTEAKERQRSIYGVTYLTALAELSRKPNEQIKISYSTDMPLIAEINNPTVKGKYYLAPRIEP